MRHVLGCAVVVAFLGACSAPVAVAPTVAPAPSASAPAPVSSATPPPTIDDAPWLIPPPATKRSPYPAITIDDVVLPGGAHLRVLPRHDVPLVALSVMMDWKDSARPAVGIFFPVVLLESRVAGARLWDRLYTEGAMVERHVDRDGAGFTVYLPPDRLEAAANAIFDTLRSGTLPPESLERAKKAQIEWLLSRGPRDRAAAHGFEVLLPTKAYQARFDGTLEDVRALTVDDFVKRKRDLFRSGAFGIGVAGDVTTSQVEHALRQALGKDKLNGPHPIPPTKLAKGIFLVRDDAIDGCEIEVALPVPTDFDRSVSRGGVRDAWIAMNSAELKTVPGWSDYNTAVAIDRDVTWYRTFVHAPTDQVAKVVFAMAKAVERAATESQDIEESRSANLDWYARGLVRDKEAAIDLAGDALMGMSGDVRKQRWESSIAMTAADVLQQAKADLVRSEIRVVISGHVDGLAEQMVPLQLGDTHSSIANTAKETPQ